MFARRKIGSWVILFALVLALMVGGLCLDKGYAALKEPVHLRFASFAIGGSWYIYASAIAKLVRPNLPEGSTIDVLPYQGGIGNPLLLKRGKAEIALSFLPCSKWAYDGLSPYKEPIKELRALVGGLNRPHRVGVLIRKASGIESLRQVVEQKLPVRIVTAQVGATGQAVAMQVLHAYGITREKLKSWGGSLEHVRMPVAMSRIKDGFADIIIHNVGYKEPRFSELCLRVPIKFMEISKEMRQKLAEKYGYMTGLYFKAGEFKGIKQDIPAIGYPTGVITTKELPDEVAYIITKSICENPKDLGNAHASLKVFDPKTAWKPEKNGIPLHPGAIEYYKDKGWMPE